MIQLQGKYKFESWNIEFENPTLEINTNSISIQPDQLTIGVNIILSVTLDNKNCGKFGYELTDIQVNNLEYNPDELVERVLTRLEDYKVSE